MSSGSSQLPPAGSLPPAASGASGGVAVRLAELPNTLQNNPAPRVLEAVVIGQEPDGSTLAETEAGLVRLVLRDRGSLPEGARLELSIPAGRPPVQAQIRPSSNASTSPAPRDAPPTLANALQDAQQTTRPDATGSSRVSLEPSALEAAITTGQHQDTAVKNAATIARTIPVVVGDIVRLIPLIPTAQNSALFQKFTSQSSYTTLISTLVSALQALPASTGNLRTTLTSLLGRLDASPLLNASGPSPNNVIQNLQSLLQPPVKTGENIFAPPRIETGISTPLPALHQEPLTLFNLSKPLDVRILGFAPAPLPDGTSAPAPPSFVNAAPTPPQGGNPPPSPSQFLLSYQVVDGESFTPTSPPIAVTLGQVVALDDAQHPILAVPLPGSGLTQLYTLADRTFPIAGFTPVFLGVDPAQGLRPSPDTTASITPPALSATLSPLSTGGQSLPLSFVAEEWGSFDNLMQALRHIAPQQAQHLANMIPSPTRPQNFGLLSLFFTGLMHSGAAENFLMPEAATSLMKAGFGELVAHLGRDLSAASTNDAPPFLPPDWKALIFPLSIDPQIFKMPVFYKQSEEQDGPNKNTKRRTLRFLFDLRFTRMGALQIDGLMRENALDMILRSKTPLSPPMQQRMKQIYAGAMEKSRLNGELSFQFKPEHWVDFTQNNATVGLRV
ncbi:MAG: hypothetical protein WC043_07160 [Pseudobdellovibrionaceae bacterium]